MNWSIFFSKQFTQIKLQDLVIGIWKWLSNLSISKEKYLNEPIVNNDRCKIWSRAKVTICFCFFEGWQCLFLPLEQNPCESTGRGGRHVPLVGNGHLDGLLVPTSTGTTTLQFVRLAITSHQVTIVSEDPASSWLEAADHQPSHHDHVAVFTDWVFCLPASPTPAQPPPLLWGDVTPLCVCVDQPGQLSVFWPARYWPRQPPPAHQTSWLRPRSLQDPVCSGLM